MAIQKDIQESNVGVGFSNSYIRISRIDIRKNLHVEESIKWHVFIWVDAFIYKPTWHAQHEVARFEYFKIDIEEIFKEEGQDFLAQCYNWLHAQPDFAGAKEV